VAARLRGGTLELRITDDGRGAPRGVEPGAEDGARGIQGMAERVSLLGGTFAAGNRAGGGFEVRATLPGGLSP
jgi:signal transduction histidine kinase